MNIDLIILISFLLLILVELLLNSSLDKKIIKVEDISNSPFLKVIIIFIYINLFLHTIMTWKLLWQIVFVSGMFMFIVMFFIFGIKGYKEIIKIMNKTNT